MNSTINIAILAHVDAGKTTLTERLLFHTGELKSYGNVDKGTTVTDCLEVEKQRGISVNAASVGFTYKDIDINIIDTPGHADFMSEVERSLLAADIAILIISASDGVQAQTRVIWSILDKLKLPRIILVNKIDRLGVDINTLLDEIKSEMSSSIIPVQNIDIQDNDNVIINSVFAAENSIDDEYLESLVEFDDELLNTYLSGNSIKDNELERVYIDSVNSSKVFPVLFAVAKQSLGIEELLDEIVKLFSKAETNTESLPSAIVFKVSHHPHYGVLSYLKVLTGVIHKKQELYNRRLGTTEKINQIKKVFSNKLMDTDEAISGQIVAVSGFADARVGDIIGETDFDKELIFNTVPILLVEVKVVNDEQYPSLAEALSQLSIEDPLLDFKWYKEEKQLLIKVNGSIQIQILEALINDRFGIEVKFEAPTIIYKETPKKIAFGFEEYTMPKPCWAVVKFKIEAAERSSGVAYKTEVGVNDVLLKYQKEVERTIPKALEQGIKGWEVTDINITLVEGEDHVMHSRPGDFAIATNMAIMNALVNSGTDLLEPVMKFELQAPEDILGQIVSDIYKMRGEFEQPIFNDGNIKISGKLPAATSMEYPITLASRSGGKATIQMQFDSYQIVELENGVVREYSGISPLDRAKFILKARKAIQ